MYTEPNGPLFRRNVDLNYNYDEEWLWASLVDVLAPDVYAGSCQWDARRLTARELATWLHYRRLALPPGSLTVHHLDSHDTFWWGEKARFRREALGQDAARILFALCAFMDGGIMSYVGAEKGSEEFYRRVLHLRRAIPELCQGDLRLSRGHLRCSQRYYRCCDTTKGTTPSSCSTSATTPARRASVCPPRRKAWRRTSPTPCGMPGPGACSLGLPGSPRDTHRTLWPANLGHSAADSAPG